MGYEIGRQAGEVDEVFLCPICALVLHNPMQTPCQHTFCNGCITRWIRVQANCPLDRSAINVDDLKPSPSYFRNILNTIEVKCNFEPKGCQTTIELGQMQHHLNACAFNPNGEVICDKGCNVKMTRREYEMHSCFTHLTNQQRRKNWKICDRMKITLDQPHILEYDGNGIRGLAQSSFSLQPTNRVFKIKVLEIYTANNIAIGLTPTGHLNGTIPGCRGTIGYWSKGYIFVDKKKPPFGPEWKIGDTVECGIIFPNSFMSATNTEVEIYFSLNSQLMFKKKMEMPIDGFFPTVYMWNDESINNSVPKVRFMK